MFFIFFQLTKFLKSIKRDNSMAKESRKEYLNDVESYRVQHTILLYLQKSVKEFGRDGDGVLVPLVLDIRRAFKEAVVDIRENKDRCITGSANEDVSTLDRLVSLDADYLVLSKYHDLF